MRPDLEMIVHKLPRNLEEARIYAIGDLHIGADDFDYSLWTTWVNKVKADPNAYVVIVGDMVDNGLKNSKTNAYQARLRPREQKEWLVRELRPIKDKILGAVPGNHERRSIKDTDDCPLYDVMCKLDIEDLYRENIAFLKINLGEKNKQRQYSYTAVLVHGGADARVKAFGASIDNMDIMFSGHNHQPKDFFPSKLVIDTKNETVSNQPYFHVIVPSMTKGEGYALESLYTPQSSITPTVRFGGKSKMISVERRWTYGN